MGPPGPASHEEAFSAPQEFAQASAELSDLDDVLKEMTKTDDDEKPEEKPED